MIDALFTVIDVTRTVAVCVTAPRQPLDKLARATKMSRGCIVIFGVIAALGLGAHLWGLHGWMRGGSAPTTPIPVVELTGTSLTGPLQEVRLTGHVRLDQLSFVAFDPNAQIFRHNRSLIPVTGPNWMPGDPVHVLLTNSWLSQSRPEDHAAGFARIGIPTDQGPAPSVTLLMAQDPFKHFKGDPAAVLVGRGAALGQPFYILEAIENKREELLWRHFEGWRALGNIFLLMGLPFVLLFLPLHIRVRRYARRAQAAADKMAHRV